MPCGKLSVFICIILSIAPATVGLRCYQNYTVTSFMWSVSHYNISECNIENSTVDLSCVRFESRVKALPGFGVCVGLDFPLILPIRKDSTVLYGKCVPTSECNEDLCSTLRVDQINPFFRKLSCTASCCSYDGCNGDMATTAASTATTVNATVPTGILTDNRGLALHNITTTEPNVTKSEISDVTTDGSPMTSAVTDVTSSRPTKINVHSRVTTSVLDSRDATTQKGGSTNLQVSAKIILSVLSIVLIVVN